MKLKVHDSIFVPLRQVGDAADRQLPLRHQGRRDHHQGSGPFRPRGIAAFGLQLRARPLHQAGAAPDDMVPFEKYAAAADVAHAPVIRRPRAQQWRAQHRTRGQAGAGHRGAEGTAHPVIDATVALVDARLEANRKKAAA